MFANILFIAICIFAIIQLRKQMAKKNKNADRIEHPSQESVSSNDDDTSDTALFRQIMQGPNGAELTSYYDKIVGMFIPNQHGEFKTSFTGYLAYTDRAKKLEKFDTNIIPLLNSNPVKYETWYNTLYDDILNQIRNHPRLAPLVQMVMNDVEQGDQRMQLSGALAKIQDPTQINSKIKISTEDYTLKINIYEKNGQVRFEVKNAYELFKTGLSLDPLIRKAEILIMTLAQYNEKRFKFEKEDIEKYAMPSVSKLNCN